MREQNRIKMILNKLKSELNNRKYEGLPTLKVSTCHGTYQYHTKNHYISKKRMDYIELLAKKEYYERLLPNLEIHYNKRDELLDLVEGEVLDNAYKSLCKGKQVLLTEICFFP